MKVYIKKLYQDYSYSEEVEEYLGKHIANNFNLKFHDETTGYNPKYDFMLDTQKFEVKFTSHFWPSIEFARADMRPSGLLLSEADYYLIISPGGSKGQLKGKIRLYKRTELLHQFILAMNNSSSNIKTYPASSSSPGSICFVIEPKQVKDIWVADCDVILDDTNKVSGFDLGTIVYNKYCKI